MIFVWGKRAYGAVHKVGNISVKTVFGHLWYLPLFPMSSYYVEIKTDAAYPLKKINLRSVLCGYVRVWMPLVFLLALIFLQNERTVPQWLSAAVMIAAAAVFIASYVLDTKYTDTDSEQVRRLMLDHFGVALDPYHCVSTMQREIDDKMQSTLADPLEHSWYKNSLNDSFTPASHKELAVLRARCDQHDAPLQQTALQRLAALPRKNI